MGCGVRASGQNLELSLPMVPTPQCRSVTADPGGTWRAIAARASSMAPKLACMKLPGAEAMAAPPSTCAEQLIQLFEEVLTALGAA